MRIVILGAPGSDTETQAKALALRHRVPRISTSDLLCAAAQGEGELSQQAQRAVGSRRRVADDIVLALLEERLRARDSKRGFIIDDFPRNIPQAQALDTLLNMLGAALQIAIYVQVADEALVKRLIGGAACEQCGAAYNRHCRPPKIRGKCDDCGGKVASLRRVRSSSAASKVAAYHQESTPLIAYYKAQHKLRTVPANGPTEEIQQRIGDLVDLEIRPLEVKTLETAAETHEEEICTIIAGGQINRIAPPPEAAAARRLGAKNLEAKTVVKAAPVRKIAKPLAKKPLAKKPLANNSAAKKSAAKKPATPKPAAAKSAAKK